MKQTGLWVLFGWAILSFCATDAFANSMYGVFMVSKGSVKIQSAANKTSDAKVGSKVYEGDTIVTGADSRAKVVMSDRNVINISPDTQIKIAQYQNDSASGKKNVELDLVKGKVRNNVEQKYEGDNSFQVKTPTAVAGVRGTQFVVSFDPGTRMTSVVTFKGAVSLASITPQGQTVGEPVTVKKGESTTVAPEAAPEPPKAMPKEEAKKADTETNASKDSGDSKRNVASDTSATAKDSGSSSTAPAKSGSMVDKKDLDTKIADGIKDPRAAVAPPPAVAPPRVPAAAPAADVVKDIIRDTAGKTKVIVRPTQ